MFKNLRHKLHKTLFMYNKILLMRSTWDWTGASLLNILCSGLVSVLKYCKFLQVVFCYCSYI